MAGGGAGLGKRRERGREGEVEGREREGPQVTAEPGTLRALLCHWILPNCGEVICSLQLATVSVPLVGDVLSRYCDSRCSVIAV